MPDDGPCFDATCPCCKTHTALERKYEDIFDDIRKLLTKAGRYPNNPTYVERAKQLLKTAGR